MSEAVDSFNDKIDEIKEDREKFGILVGEFFDSKDINIKELLAEMMLHVIMTRGEELQIKFKELEDQRSMYGDWGIGQTIYQPGIQITPSIPCVGSGVGTGPNVWTSTSSNTYIASSSTLNLGDLGKNVSYTNTSNCFNIDDLDVGSIVENVEFESSDTGVNTKLFQDAVSAMSVWNVAE